MEETKENKISEVSENIETKEIPKPTEVNENLVVQDETTLTVKTSTASNEFIQQTIKNLEDEKKIPTRMEKTFKTSKTLVLKSFSFGKRFSMFVGNLLRKFYLSIKRLGQNVKIVCLYNSLVAMFFAGFTFANSLWYWMTLFLYLTFIHLRSLRNKELVFGFNVLLCTYLCAIASYTENWLWSGVMLFFILTHISNILHIPSGYIARKTEDIIHQLSNPG